MDLRIYTEYKSGSQWIIVLLLLYCSVLINTTLSIIISAKLILSKKAMKKYLVKTSPDTGG